MRRRRAARVAAVLLVTLLALVGVGAMGAASAAGTVYPARDGSAPPVPVGAVPSAPYDPGRPTAVVVLGPDGANVADVLAPYEVLAETGAFNLYTVAPERRPTPLSGGLDVVPDLSFAELDAWLPTAADVIVVPELPGAGGPSTAVVEDWLLRQRAEGDPLLVSVCVGAAVLASAGLLDGRPATSHWLGLIGLRRSYTAVQWQDGVRFVDDGDVITTAGVLSGVDGALRVVERTVGPAAAEGAARAVRWPDYSPGRAAAIPRSRPAPADAVAVLSAGYRWDRPTTGVLLTEGVGEIELASAFRPYTVLSYLARPVAVTVDGRPVRSRHGLTFAPRAALGSVAAELDRLLVPGPRRADDGGETALAGRLPPVHLHDQPGFAFDGALRDIARTEDAATARWVAKSLQYPRTGVQLVGPAWPWGLTLRPILIAAAAATASVLVLRLRRRRRARATAHGGARRVSGG
jgi:putative intracellular protease/amidase